MLDLTIPAMSCGHCVRAITAAATARDPQATVSADLPQHQVHVETQLPREVLVTALTEAGYPPN